MNALIFVTSMLMLLSIMTYARLDSYRIFSATQAEFENYMMNTERVFVNAQAELKFKDIKGTNQKKTDHNKNKAVKASRYLSWNPLLNTKDGEKNLRTYADTLEITKRLLFQLYGNKSFFTLSLSQNPNLIEDLLNKIKKSIEELPENQRPKKIKDLANLDLKDSFFNELLYKMFKGHSIPDLKQMPAQSNSTEQEDEEEEQEGDEICEGSFQPNQQSLQDFISLNPNLKIRVFLAPPTLLKAIYGDEHHVNKIIETRNELYAEVMKKEGKDPNLATKEFENTFKGRLTSFDEETLLDYTVSKTDPR